MLGGCKSFRDFNLNFVLGKDALNCTNLKKSDSKDIYDVRISFQKMLFDLIFLIKKILEKNKITGKCVLSSKAAY